MNRFSAALSTEGNWRDAAAECARALRCSGERALGFVYATTALEPNLAHIVAYLRVHTAIEHWVGTVGVGVLSNGREDYDGPALSVLATDLAVDDFLVMPSVTDDVSPSLGRTRAWRLRNGSFFGIVHGDPRNAATPQIVADLADGLGGGFLVGGLTSSQGNFPQVADEQTHGGVSGVLLSGNVNVVTGLTQGCSLIGHAHVVTEASGNVVVALDDRPALDVLREDIGELLARDLARIAGYIFVALPVLGSDTGDYLVRNLVGIDPNSGLMAIGDRVQRGSALRFARRDGQTAREDLLRMLKDLKARVAGRLVRGALYVSCLGRGRHLFGRHSEELRMIRAELGELPLVGFFANGEISHNRVYGYTGVLTLFL